MSMVVLETYAKDANYWENSSKHAPYERIMEEKVHQLPRDLNLNLQTSGRICYKNKVYTKRLVKDVVDTKMPNDCHIHEDGSKLNHKMNDVIVNIDKKDNYNPVSKSLPSGNGIHTAKQDICHVMNRPDLCPPGDLVVQNIP